MNTYLDIHVGIISIISIQYDFVTKCFKQMVNIFLVTVYSNNM